MNNDPLYFDKYASLKYFITIISLFVSICLKSARGLYVTSAIILVSFFADYFQFGDEIAGKTREGRVLKTIMYLFGCVCLCVSILLMFYSTDIRIDAFDSFDQCITVNHKFVVSYEPTYKEFSIAAIIIALFFGVLATIKPYILIRVENKKSNSTNIFFLIDKVF